MKSGDIADFLLNFAGPETLLAAAIVAVAVVLWFVLLLITEDSDE